MAIQSQSLFEGVHTLVFDAFGTLVRGQGTLDVPAAIRPVLLAATKPDCPPIPWGPVWQAYDELKIGDLTGELTPRRLWQEFLRVFEERLADWLGLQSWDDVFGVDEQQLIGRLSAAERGLYANVQFHPRAEGLLMWAGAQGYHRMLCSNATQSGLTTLLRLGLDRYFRSDDMFVSCLGGYQKLPDDDADLSLFDLVADYGLDSGPADTLFIEDEEPYIKKIRSLGFRTILVGKPASTRSSATLVVPDVADISRHLPQRAARRAT